MVTMERILLVTKSVNRPRANQLIHRLRVERLDRHLESPLARRPWTLGGFPSRETREGPNRSP